MKSIRIAHLTDMHYRYHTPGSSHKHKNRSREMFLMFPRALDLIKKEKVDIIVVTGDIVDTPGIVLKHNSYYMDLSAPFKKLIRKDYLAIRSVLDHSGIPWIVIPGNKDDHELFMEMWGDQPLIRDFGGFRFVSFHDRQWEGSQPRRFDRERRLMEKALADPSSPPQIHLQHFLSSSSARIQLKHVYKEAENLRALCRDSGKVVLSLSGHYHPGIKGQQEKMTTWISAPAFCAQPFPFLIHELKEDGSIQTQRMEAGKRSIHKGKKVVVLDRDGVISQKATYETGPEEMKLIPGAAMAIRKLKEAGFAVIVNTNQSCIGRGYVPESIVLLNNEYMCCLLAREAGDPQYQPDAIFFSTGAGKSAVHPDYRDISNTKPSPLLLDKAIRLLGLKRKNGWMIGDREGDIQCALNGGLAPILVRTGDGKLTETIPEIRMNENLTIKNDILEAAEFIINNQTPKK